MSQSFGFFTISISVRLSDRSPHREEQKKKKNFQKLPPVRTEPRTSGSSVLYSTDCTSLVCVGQKISEVGFVSCTTSHFGLWSFLESEEHDFITEC